MTARRIFVVGSRGQVAIDLAAIYTARGYAVCCAGRETFDITDRIAVVDRITAYHPDLIVNAAAYTDVDKAESETERAFLVNRDGARHVAFAARILRRPLIHVSTDYVFDGRKSKPYVETDRPAPLNVYGASKLAGEVAVAAETNNYVVLRSGWIYGPHSTNFAKTILRLAAQRDELKVVDDQTGAPTCSQDLAVAICRVGDHLVESAGPTGLAGVYHATASGATSWYGFARAIVDRLATKGGRPIGIVPIASGESGRPARRPLNSLLNCSKLGTVFAIDFPNWAVSLEAVFDRVLKQAYETMQ